MNNQPTKEEINKKLAEFMGDKKITQTMLNVGVKNYTESLDALAPVWERLDLLDSLHEFLFYRHALGYSSEINYLDRNMKHITSVGSDGETIQEAAALATYYAVMEDEKNG